MDNSTLLISIISSVIVFIMIYGYLKREFLPITVKSAAKSTRGILSRFALPRRYKVLSDITLEGANEKINIENMLIGYFGILIVRTFGARGEYYGTLDDDVWSFAAKDRKYSVQNPVKHLDREEAALRALFAKNKVYKIQIEKIVYVSNKSNKTAVYVSHGGEILLGGKLAGYLEKSKFEKDTGIDVKQVSDVIMNNRIV